MEFVNRHRFERQATAGKASAVDRHRTPLPPGRCRDVPVLTPAEQVTRLYAAHQLTKSAAQQAAAYHQHDMWDANMQLLRAEEELDKERSSHGSTKMQLYGVQAELDATQDALRDKEELIAALVLRLSKVEVQRDEAYTDAADMRTALRSAQATVQEQARTISNMEQQLSTQINAMALLHHELTTQVAPMQPTSPQLQQHQAPTRHTGLFGALQGSLPDPSAANTMRHGLRAHSTASSRANSSSTGGTPSRAPAPALNTPPLSVLLPPTALPAAPTTATCQRKHDSDALDTIKATTSILLSKTSQGVRQGWSKAVAWGADNGISLGFTRQPSLGSSSGASSRVLSRRGSCERNTSAAPSRRCSNSSRNSNTNSSSSVTVL